MRIGALRQIVTLNAVLLYGHASAEQRPLVLTPPRAWDVPAHVQTLRGVARLPNVLARSRGRREATHVFCIRQQTPMTAFADFENIDTPAEGGWDKVDEPGGAPFTFLSLDTVIFHQGLQSMHTQTDLFLGVGVLHGMSHDIVHSTSDPIDFRAATITWWQYTDDQETIDKGPSRLYLSDGFDNGVFWNRPNTTPQVWEQLSVSLPVGGNGFKGASSDLTDIRTIAFERSPIGEPPGIEDRNGFRIDEVEITGAVGMPFDEVLSGMLVRFRGRDFLILDVTNVDEDGRFLKLTCELYGDFPRGRR